MELFGHLVRPEHRSRAGKQRVHAAYPGRNWTLCLRFEVDDLKAGMHAAIGAPGSRGGDPRIGNRGERRLERILYRPAAGLGLPAKEATTVVLQP